MEQHQMAHSSRVETLPVENYGESDTSSVYSEENDNEESDQELDELERYELEDTIGEMMPIAFGRRHRREGLFGSSVARSILPDGSWDATNESRVSS